MNVRKAILILGILAVAIIAAIVTVAVLAHRKMELERNRAKTEPGRLARLQKLREAQSNGTSTKDEQEAADEEIKTLIDQHENSSPIPISL